MTKLQGAVNGAPNATIAPLRNVALFNELVGRLVDRPAYLPGIGAFYGFSGYGKTFSATYAANKYRALYVEAGVSWTRKTFVERVLQEAGVQKPRGTIANLTDQVIEALSISTRPLIIDEADHLIARGVTEIIREIHDKSGAPVILIGEELLPRKLAEHERFHNRVLSWVPAMPADLDDAGHLVRLYAPGLTISADLLARIVTESKGQVRRIAVNIDRCKERARTKGTKVIDLDCWGKEPFFTGAAPIRNAIPSLGKAA